MSLIITFFELIKDRIPVLNIGFTQISRNPVGTVILDYGLLQIWDYFKMELIISDFLKFLKSKHEWICEFSPGIEIDQPDPILRRLGFFFDINVKNKTFLLKLLPNLLE